MPGPSCSPNLREIIPAECRARVCGSHSAGRDLGQAQKNVMNSDSSEGPLLITVDDAAKQLAVSRRTLHREMNRGRFPRPLKIGRVSRVEVSAVAEYLARLRKEVAS